MRLSVLVVLGVLLCITPSYAAIITNPITCNAGGLNTSACEVQSLAWFSQSSAIMITYDNKAWLTNNEGQSFTVVATKVNSIVVYPQHPEAMFLLPTFGVLAVYTADGGKSFKNMTMPVGRAQIETIQAHPTQLGWLMIVGCTTTNHLCTLYNSKDFGTTWTTSFTNNIAYETLGSPAVWGNSTSEPDLIFLLLKTYKFGYTTDYKTFIELFSEVFWFTRSKYYYWVVEGSNGASRLQSSSYRLDSTHKSKGSYQIAAFPSGATYANQDYLFLDDTTRAEYVALHTAKYGDWGDVYTSEFDGLTFELSLPNVFRYEAEYGIWYDFHRVRGLGGIYIANVVKDTSARILSRQSVITFDNGGDWKLLTPPATDMNGKPWPCGSFGPTCSLHLQGETGVEIASVQALRSHSSAVGLIIANGNVGAQVAEKKGPLSTFLSRDGGLTWAQIYSQASVFEFGNNGGVIVLAPMTKTNSIYYSFDQGATIEKSSVNLSNTQYVYNIGTEPNGTGLNFIIQGYDGSNAFYFSSFSLADAGLPQCGDIDYEQWHPSNGLGTSFCFMGQTTTYLRRTMTSKCFSSRDLSSVIDSDQCACSWEDYECAPNYSPSARNSSAGFVCSIESAPLAQPCQSGQKYRDPTGYQLVPDTSCKLSTGLDLVGPLKSCPSKSHPAEVIAAVTVTLLVVGAIVSLIVLYKRNDRFRSWVESLKGGRTSGRYKDLNHVNDEEEDEEDNTA